MSRRLRGARSSPIIHRPTVGLILLLVVSMPFLGDMFGVRHRALASFADPQAGPLRITSPSDSSVVGDGNLILVEGTAINPANGRPDKVELSIDGSETWVPTDQDASDPSHWRYIRSDPAPGFHRVRARSANSNRQTVLEQSVIVQVSDVWSTPFTILHHGLGRRNGARGPDDPRRAGAHFRSG